jgi:hypothetical protein
MFLFLSLSPHLISSLIIMSDTTPSCFSFSTIVSDILLVQLLLSLTSYLLSNPLGPCFLLSSALVVFLSSDTPICLVLAFFRVLFRFRGGSIFTQDICIYIPLRGQILNMTMQQRTHGTRCGQLDESWIGRTIYRWQLSSMNASRTGSLKLFCPVTSRVPCFSLTGSGCQPA